MEYTDSYLQVDPDFYDIIRSFEKVQKKGKIHYMGPDNTIEDAKGTLKGINITDKGEFLIIDEANIRLDKIITLFGKPGPWYEEYEKFANACLTCEDLGQF